METKAEKCARVFVSRFFNDMKNDKFRGPNYDSKTFDIVGLVDVQLFASYCGNVPSKSRKKALKLALELWNKLNGHKTVVEKQ